ncbi:MAG: ATP-dependent DNA helicase RecQ [Cryomorphaceae bacterium]
MDVKAPVEDILKKYWGFQSFRPLQQEIVETAISGRDAIALLPTGGGKSICFQVPAMAMEGVCIVISPLIALMRDQVQNLKKIGIKATAINSSLSRKEIDIALDNAVYGDTKFLYLSPERLKSEVVVERIKKMKICLVAIDEAHCISEWGFDFRPAYREIAELRELLPKTPFLALTATATPQVVEDIAVQLELKDWILHQKSFSRENLIYVFQEEKNKLARTLSVIERIGGSGILYVGSRKETVRQANLLRANGVSAMAYHGGMNNAERSSAQDLWVKGRAQVMVATNAFGMGIDKADVRFVVHQSLPLSLEAYFQEAGRAGRDEKLAYAVMFVDEFDRELQKKRVAQMVPSEKEITRVYRALSNYLQLASGSDVLDSFPFSIGDFAKKYNFNVNETYNCLKVLEISGHLTLSDAIHSPSKVQFAMRSKNLYNFEIAQPRYEAIIHLLLRSHEGIFEHPVKINENNMGVRLKISASDVRQKLRQLEEFRVVRYKEQSELPFMTINNRVRVEALKIDREYLDKQRKRWEERFGAMLNYTENSVVCRSRQLLIYFGEKNPFDCGKCDVCLKRKKVDTSWEGFDQIRQIIREKLNGGETNLSELKHHPKFKSADILQVIRWLAEHEIIAVDTANRVKLK